MSKPLRFIEEPARSTPIKAETQVLVIGGGSAGVSAAVAAARQGADVTLVERLGYLGGLASGGMIILLLTLDDGRGRQVVGGLCQEVTERLDQRGAARFPSPDEWGSADEALLQRDRSWGLVWGHGPHRVRYSVAYDPEELKFALNGMAEDARVQLLMHTHACEAIVEGDRITGVTFQSKAGRFAILADVIIDASGDGDIFVSAGSAYEKEKVLPWLWFSMGGVENPDDAIRAGGWFFHTIGKDKVLLPWGATDKVSRKIDATDPDDLTYAELECRKQVMAEVDRPAERSPRLPQCLSVSYCRPTRHYRKPALGRRVYAQPGRDGYPLRGRDRHHRPLDQIRKPLLYSVPLPSPQRVLKSAGGRPLYLGRSPRPSCHQGNPALHGNRRSRRDRGRPGRTKQPRPESSGCKKSSSSNSKPVGLFCGCELRRFAQICRLQVRNIFH